MDKPNDGGPAFPCATKQREVTTRGFGTEIFEETVLHPGMSLRDYFAAKMLQGLMAAPDGFYTNEHESRAEVCYKQADAMIKARNG